ncbi:MAG: hypothetical protein RSB67_01525 [Clostridia bacterium]
MIETVQNKRLSLISEIIIFLCIILFSILVIKKITANNLENVEYEQTMSLIIDKKTAIQEENKLYLLKIKKDYGITVLYGSDTQKYMKKIDAIEQSNENIVNNNLKTIYSSLEKYPKEVFDNLKESGFPLYILFVDKFNNNNLALASRNNLNEYKIYISNNDKFERAFHHEMYHILEYYMISKNKDIFKLWDNLNPKKFRYEENLANLTKDYVALIDEQTRSYITDENPYFVSKYSKSSPKEDRAEIFAELMIMNKRKYYLEKKQNILFKAIKISNSIKENITKGDFYFTRYLNINIDE